MTLTGAAMHWADRRLTITCGRCKNIFEPRRDWQRHYWRECPLREGAFPAATRRWPELRGRRDEEGR